ncbi:hypothetical protein ONZ51_g7872 [Trametes cubensis]|uniref:Uncharacterized protein n=1 Tax=Trametes cubensis TaxID=1111947 RepID=A0AAD7X926_9APHY|nr:hypothetical protein ONZ51_g7872 [Trametes cubensis]
MPKGKLRMKRTPAEEAERAWKKAQKAARKAAKHKRYADDDFVDPDSEYGPQPAPSGSGAGQHRAHKPDYDQIAAEVEEMRFREKLYDAMGDDERLDSVEASMNSYAHIPRRWRGGGMDRMEDDLTIDPQYMEDEDYAEWVRAGMWKKKHAAEHEEQLRRHAERKARKEREKALREETRRLERAAEEERRQRRRERDRSRAVQARESYDVRWKELLSQSTPAAPEGTMRFADVPWPVLPPSSSSKRGEQQLPIALEDLTTDAISSFLLPATVGPADEETAKKDRKEKLRETMLRFHPDKFEGRVMRLVRSADKEMVKEGVGIVARTLNALMNESK